MTIVATVATDFALTFGVVAIAFAIFFTLNAVITRILKVAVLSFCSQRGLSAADTREKVRNWCAIATVLIGCGVLVSALLFGVVASQIFASTTRP